MVAVERIPNIMPPVMVLKQFIASCARDSIALNRHDERLDTLGQDTQTPSVLALLGALRLHSDTHLMQTAP